MSTEKRYSVRAAAEGCFFAFLVFAAALLTILFIIDSAFDIHSRDTDRIVVAVLWPFTVGYAGYRATRSRFAGTSNAAVVGILAMLVLVYHSDDSMTLTDSLVTPTIDWIKIIMLGLALPSALAGGRIRLKRDAEAQSAGESVDRPRRLVDEADDKPQPPE